MPLLRRKPLPMRIQHGSRQGRALHSALSLSLVLTSVDRPWGVGWSSTLKPKLLISPLNKQKRSTSEKVEETRASESRDSGDAC